MKLRLEAIALNKYHVGTIGSANDVPSNSQVEGMSEIEAAKKLVVEYGLEDDVFIYVRKVSFSATDNMYFKVDLSKEDKLTVISEQQFLDRYRAANNSTTKSPDESAYTAGDTSSHSAAHKSAYSAGRTISLLFSGWGWVGTILGIIFIGVSAFSLFFLGSKDPFMGIMFLCGMFVAISGLFLTRLRLRPTSGVVPADAGV
jgi:hypothetical protein